MKKLFFSLILFVFMTNPISAEINFTGMNDNLEVSASFPDAEFNSKILDSETFSSVSLENCETTFVNGFELQVTSQLVDLPSTGNYSVTNLTYDHQEIYLESKLSPFMTEMDVNYNIDAWLPEEIINIGEPAIMRGVRFSQISIFPIQYNPARNAVRIISDLEAEFQIDPSDDRNPLLRQRDFTGFSKLNKHIHGRDDNRDVTGGSYLIISPQSVSNQLQPFLRWKEKLGFTTKLSTIEEIGDTAADIKAYLQNAYDNWEIPPEFVVLVGDVTGNYIVPSNYIQGYLYPWCVTDHTYTLLEGDDYFPDIMIGRLSFQDEMQLMTMLAKIINYEKNPYVGSDWFKSALMAGLVDTWNGHSQRETLLEVRQKLLDFEYTKVDTFFAPWQHGQTQLANEINTGHSFICYRGTGSPTYWGGGSMGHLFTNSNILNLNNGFMLPMVMSMTCGGGDFAAAETPTCFGEVWMFAGSPSVPKGAIGFIGPSERDTKVQFNNAKTMGIYQGITHEDIYTCGGMLLRGKMELYNNFPFGHELGSAEDSDQFYFYVYNLLGDPGLRVWTDIPKTIELEAGQLFVGSNYISASVLTEDDPADFTIALTSADSLLAVGITNSSGTVNIPVSLSEGSYQLTASRYGYIPRTIDIEVLPAEILALESYTFNQSTISGQTLDVDLIIRNLATTAASDINIELTSQNEVISIISETLNVNSLAANNTFEGSFTLQIAAEWLDGRIFDLILIINSNLGENLALIPIEVSSPDLAMVEYEVLNNSGCLIQNEAADLNLKLYNSGQIASSTVYATLECLNELVEINSAGSSYNSIEVGDSKFSLDPFNVTAQENIINGETAQFRLILEDSGSILQDILFEIPIGVISQTSPTFCDWGYLAIESKDIGNFDAPVYDWLEIDPNLGGEGSLLTADHSNIDGYIKTISLPFQFRYFGLYYDEISVCSEGYITMGRSNTIFFRNRTIPSGSGSPAMIAPFWDSLEGGEMYTFYDVENNRVIIQWSDWGSTYDPTKRNTFQVILLDPNYHGSSGHDSQLIFQYKEIHNINQAFHYATIGIENEAQTEGLLLTFANLDHPTFHPIENETAIFFTMKTSPDIPYLTSDITSIETIALSDTVITQLLTLHNNAVNSDDLEFSLSFSHFAFSHFGRGNQFQQNPNRSLENDFILQMVNSYIPNEIFNMTFYLVHNSPDGEPITGVTMDFPEGCHIYSASNLQTLQWNGETGDGIEISWGFTGGTISPTTAQVFEVNMFIEETMPSPLVIDWYIEGDGSGAEPHFAQGTISIPVTTDEVFWITYPNGGESVLPALQDTIRWNHFGDAENVQIKLSRNAGANWEMIADNAPNLEYLPHVFDGPLAENCLLYVGTCDGDFWDESDDYFQITSLNIAYPNAESILSYSHLDSLIWQDVAGMETVDISLSMDNGFTWQTVEEAYPNTGSYYFEVFGPPSKYCQFKLSNDAYNVQNFSEIFEIVDCPVDWLQADIYQGSIPPGQSQQIQLSVSTQELDFGIYKAYIRLQSQIGQVLYVPVLLEYLEDMPPVTQVVLKQNVPNPFNPITRIDYQIPSACKVKISIFNVRGQHVKTLVNEFKNAGEHYEYWNATDKNDDQVSSGIYYLLLKAGNETKTRKMTLLK